MKHITAALYQSYGVGEDAVAKFFKAQGVPVKGVKRFAPVLLGVEKQDGNIHRFTISTPDEDRDSDVLVSTGAILTHYKKNPIVLWVHDYYSLPIGRSLSIQSGPDGVVAEMEYAPTEFAQQVRLLVDTGFLKGSSVGFNPLAWEQRQDQATVDQWGWAYPGYKYNEWELLEWSIVPVPCNPYALVEEAKSQGMDVRVIEQKMKENVPKKNLLVTKDLKQEVDVRDGKCYDKETGAEVPCPEDVARSLAAAKKTAKDPTDPVDTSPAVIVGEDGKCYDNEGVEVECPDGLVPGPGHDSKAPILGKPFGEYDSFEDCVGSNQDKDDPEAFCAYLEHEVTGEWPAEEALTPFRIKRLLKDRKDTLVTVDEMKTLCAPCAAKMQAAGFRAIKISALGRLSQAAGKPAPAESTQAKQGVIRIKDAPGKTDGATFKLPATRDELAVMMRTMLKDIIRRDVLGKVD